MAVPTVVARSIRLRVERLSRCGVLRFRASPDASGPPPWAVRARRAPLPEPDNGSRNRYPTPTQRRARLPVRGVFILRGTQS